MRNVPLAPAVASALLVVLALLVPVIGLADPVRMNIVDRFALPSANHWLGADEYGRDVLSRIVWGARTSLSVAFSASVLAAVVGTALGVLGGFLRGAVEFVALRLTDVLLCFPPLLLALLVVTLFGPGASTLIPILAIVYAPGFARVAYSGVLSARSRDYVEAVRALGASPARIMLRTILPNISGPTLVQFSLAIAASVVLESGLSFLGLGVVPPAPSWGLMIGSARGTMAQAPQLLLWPSLALTLTILTINALCDGLRDMVDPHPGHKRKRRVVDVLAPGLMPPRDSVLAVDGLTVSLDLPGGTVDAVRDVAFTVNAGETVALVGESGSGKSLASLALLQLLPLAARVRSGAAWINGLEVLRSDEETLRGMRGSKVAMIFQDPTSSLNPSHRVGDQIAEAVTVHNPCSRAAANARAVELLRQVGVPDPASRARSFPHELSGGMRQRVMIAMAIANDPMLLIADEPTTALDVTVQAQVLELLLELKRAKGIALLFITHSLPVVAEIADRVVVLYAGEVLEQGPTAEVFARPLHPYTRALLDSAPSEEGPPPEAIPGTVPPVGVLPPGCVFAPRCGLHLPECDVHPPLVELGSRMTRCRRWREM